MTLTRPLRLWTALILIVAGTGCDDPKAPLAPLPPAPVPTPRSLSGYIRAADTGGPLIARVNVKREGSTYESGSQMTDESGRFRFENVGGAIQVSAGAQGFEFMSTHLQVNEDLTRDFLLTPQEPAALNIAGNWRVSLSASRSCRAKLPSIARERKYAAFLQQESSQLRITLNSPTLSWRDGPHGTFTTVGSLTGAQVQFGVANDWDEPLPISERNLHDEVGPGQTLELVGSVSGTSTDRQITATFSGLLAYRDLNGEAPAVCEALDHEMLFKR